MAASYIGSRLPNIRINHISYILKFRSDEPGVLNNSSPLSYQKYAGSFILIFYSLENTLTYINFSELADLGCSTVVPSILELMNL